MTQPVEVKLQKLLTTIDALIRGSKFPGHTARSIIEMVDASCTIVKAWNDIIERQKQGEK